MLCPRCGHKLKIDGHRKIDMLMCYECGYIEGRNIGHSTQRNISNYERLRGLNFNEAVAFLSEGLGVDDKKLASWMEQSYNRPAGS